MKDRQIDRDRWIEIETKEAEEREREIVKEKQRKEGRIENGIKKKKKTIIIRKEFGKNESTVISHQHSPFVRNFRTGIHTHSGLAFCRGFEDGQQLKSVGKRS